MHISTWSPNSLWPSRCPSQKYCTDSWSAYRYVALKSPPHKSAKETLECFAFRQQLGSCPPLFQCDCVDSWSRNFEKNFHRDGRMCSFYDIDIDKHLKEMDDSFNGSKQQKWFRFLKDVDVVLIPSHQVQLIFYKPLLLGSWGSKSFEIFIHKRILVAKTFCI